MAPSKKANTKAQKRSTEAVTSKAKRAKVVAPKPVDPVQEKINAVVAAIEDVEYEVAGPFSCREMLTAAAPIALKTLQDERHSYQETVFGMFAEVFEAEEMRRQGIVAEEKVKVEAADTEQAMRQAAKDSVEAEVQAKKEEIVAKKEVLSEDNKVVESEEMKLHEACEEKSCAEDENQIHMQDKEKCLQLQKEHFEMLKEGAWETMRDLRSHVSVLTPFFKKLSVDASLVTAMQSALGKKPVDRGSFDNMVVEQIQETLTKHLLSLEEKLASTEAVVAEKSTTADAIRATLEICQDKQTASSEAVRAAEVERKELEVAMKERTRAVKEQEASVAAVASELSIAEFRFEQVQEVKGFLTFLQERVEVPEAEPVVEEECEVVAAEAEQDIPMFEPVIEEVTPVPDVAKSMRLEQPVETDLRVAGM